MILRDADGPWTTPYEPLELSVLHYKMYCRIIWTGEGTDNVVYSYRKQWKETNYGCIQRGALGASHYHFSATSFKSGSLTKPEEQLVASNLQQSSCLHPSASTGVKAYNHTWLFTWVMGIWTLVLMLMYRAFYPLNHLPSLPLISWNIKYQNVIFNCGDAEIVQWVTALAAEAWRPEFGSQNPHKKPELAATVTHGWIGELFGWGWGDGDKIILESCWPTSQLQVHRETFSQRSQGRAAEQDTRYLRLDSEHTGAHTSHIQVLLQHTRVQYCFQVPEKFSWFDI